MTIAAMIDEPNSTCRLLRCNDIRVPLFLGAHSQHPLQEERPPTTPPTIAPTGVEPPLPDPCSGSKTAKVAKPPSFSLAQRDQQDARTIARMFLVTDWFGFNDEHKTCLPLVAAPMCSLAFKANGDARPVK